MTDTPRSQWDALNCRVNGRSLRAYWTVISCSRIWTWVKLLCAAHIGKPTSVLCLHLEVLGFPAELQGLLILSYVQSQKTLARVEMLSLTTFLCGFGGGNSFSKYLVVSAWGSGIAYTVFHCMINGLRSAEKYLQVLWVPSGAFLRGKRLNCAGFVLSISVSGSSLTPGVFVTKQIFGSEAALMALRTC